MSEQTYILWYRGQDSTTSAKNVQAATMPIRPTYINSDVMANIPKYSIISKAVVALEIKRNGSSDAFYNTDVSWVIRDTSNEVISTLSTQYNVISTSYKEFKYDYTAYFESGTSNAGLINASLCDHFGCIGSGTSIRTYTARYRRIEYTFIPPTYNINAIAETGGTVSGGGTYDVTMIDQTKIITATPNAGYKFIGWKNSNGSIVSTNNSISITMSHNSISAHSTTVSYVAAFEKITCDVTFKNYDNTILQVSSVNNGDTPSYTGATPTKASTAQYTYTFSGWYPALSAVKTDTTYTAQFISRCNGVYAGTSRVKAIYVGTIPVKTAYVGTIKVYEQ